MEYYQSGIPRHRKPLMVQWKIAPIAERMQVAAMDSSAWPEVLDYMTHIMEVAGVVLFSSDPNSIVPPSSKHLLNSTDVYMKDGWSKNDLRYLGIPKMLKKGVMTDQDFITDAGIQKSPYYQDFLKPHGLGSFAGVGFQAGADLWVLSVQRHYGQNQLVNGS
jgi:hypothetical protein